jgi:diguanylate cyclase (GGDEF)-like protein
VDYKNNNKSRSGVPRFFVAGAAHLDIISVAAGPSATLDKPGTLHLDIGGTGFNLANNLRALGGDINLLTALPASPFTDIILDSLAENGIQVFAKQHESLQLGGFSAHLNSSGEVISAVSASPVELYQFEDLEIDEVLHSATAAIADCNLNSGSLAKIANRVGEAGVPFFVAGVSQEKSLRLEVCLGFGHTFFLNKDEFHYFFNNTGRRHLLESFDALELGKTTGSNWLVSDGANGVSYYSASETFSLEAPPLNAVLTLPGAGDMLLAATVWYLTQGLPLNEAAKRGMLQVTRVAERKNCSLAAANRIESAMHSITQATRTDLMTNLQNRRGLEREMESQAMKALARKGLVSAVILDIDKFKAINDEFGHAVGDAVISWVAAQLKFSIREHDVAGRWGGEEFIVLLPGEALDGAALVAERIRARVQEHSTSSGEIPRQITVSIGVACCNPGESFDSVINRADKALYRAKANGRNRVELAAS